MKISQLCVILSDQNNHVRLLNYISFVLFATCFFSCEEEISIDYIDVEKFVVVNSSFSPSKEFEIQLDFSRNILDDEEDPTFISDADVRIFNEQGGFILQLEHVANGLYLTPDHTHPIEDKIYKLEVKVDGYPTIKAESRVPKSAIVENIVSTEIVKSGSPVVKVDFDIEDAEDIDNYYIWEVFTGDKEETATAQSTFVSQGIQTLGPSESAVNNGKWGKLFIQEMDLVQGVSFLSFPVNNTNGISGGQTDPSPDDEEVTFLKVISASSDYYNYLLSVELHENTRNDNGAGSGSSSSLTPIELHTNIEGGLGIFAGYNEQTHELEH